MTRQTPSRLRVWLQLFRAPNLFTVPGDPLGGYLLVNDGWMDWSLACVIAASLCFYAAGLLMNDLADEAEDRRERPNRPLPAGQATRRTVTGAMLGLCIVGMLALALTRQLPAVGAGAVLIAAMALYNYFTKHWPVIGALNMGACRGLSVMLGGLAGPEVVRYAAQDGDSFSSVGLLPATSICLYIAAVTNLARHETRADVPVLPRLLPAFTGILSSVYWFDLIRPGSFGRSFVQPFIDWPLHLQHWICVCTGLWLLRLAIRLFQRPAAPLPPLIGAHIRVLLPMQATFCFSAGNTIAGLLLLLAWPLSRAVSKRFYAS